MNPLSMYRQLLGDAFARLPAPVRRLHSLQGKHVLTGWVQVEAPGSPVARLLAMSLGTPRSAHSGPLRFELDAGPTTEDWTRHFPSQTMRSRLSLDGTFIAEQLGLARLRFSLVVVDAQLQMKLVQLKFLGIPAPAWLRPAVVAEESGDGERFEFRVRATLPWVGLVAAYQGHLTLPSGETD